MTIEISIEIAENTSLNQDLLTFSLHEEPEADSLCLTGDDLNATIIEVLCKTLAFNSHKITTLTIKSNGDFTEGLETLANHIKKMVSLKTINLQETTFSHSALAKITERLGEKDWAN